MDARRIFAAFLAVALLSGGSLYGAVAKSRNFVVETPNPHFAQQAAQLAEKYRRDLALEWLGHELPAWSQPCPIRIHVGTHLGAGGATSFCFHNGRPFDWRMNIQGPPDRLLDSVLPHEVLHTVFATHFGCPLPRWADEGACTTIEHPSEKSKYHQSLIEALTSGRGIPFNRMFAMKDYPHDVLPLYAQGHSLARFLIAQGGKQRYVAFVGDGIQWNNWTAAIKKHYGFESLSSLQVTWNNWVAKGCPALQPTTPENGGVLLADARGETDAEPGGSASPRNERLASDESSAAGGVFTASLAGDGWYDRNRRAKAASIRSAASQADPAASPTDIATLPRDQSTARPQQPQTLGQIILPEGYHQPRPGAVSLPSYGQPLRPQGMPAAAPPAPMTVAPRPAPVRQGMPAAPSSGMLYTMPNAVPLTASPAYLGGACFGGT
jgi:hypothetical protein